MSDEAFNDSDRVEALESLLTNCPHAKIIYNDDPDRDDPVGWTLRVEGCETTEDTAGDLRSCLDFEVRRQRFFASR